MKKTIDELAIIAAKAIKTICDETNNAGEIVCILALMETAGRHQANLSLDKKINITGVETA